MTKNNNQTGFTLIELLIVIGIIAVLASAVVVAINPGQQFAQARDASRRSHINSIRQAVLSYQIDKQGNLPTELLNSTGGEICNPNTSTCPTDSIDLSFLTPNYIATIPVDPAEEETSDTTGYGIANVGNRIATWATESETERIGRRPALNFDGEDDYVDVGNDNTFNIENEITLSAWIRVPDIGTRSEDVISKGTTFGGTQSYSLAIHNSDRIIFEVNVNDGDRRARSVYDISDYNDEWIYIAGTYNGTDSYQYWNGEQVGHSSYSEDTIDITDLPLKIGGERNLNGKINDVRIYNRALSESEIQSLYNGQNITNGLVGYWPLNEGQGGVAYDRSGNGNDGALMPNYPDNNPEWTISN